MNPNLTHVMLLGEAMPIQPPSIVQCGNRMAITVTVATLNGLFLRRVNGPWGTEHYPVSMSVQQCAEAYWGITDSLEAAVAQLGRTIEEKGL